MMTSGLIGAKGPPKSSPKQEATAVDMVRCIQGANEQNLPLAGRSVAWVRANLRDILNISARAVALIEGHLVSEEHILKSGDALEFLLREGRKGVGHLWKDQVEIMTFFGLSEDQYWRWRSLGLPVHEFPDGRVLLTETDFDEWSRSISIPTLSPRRGRFGPGDPCPDLMTEDEAILYLRLDTIDIKNPQETLRRYRRQGYLRGTQVGKRVFYLRSELDALLKKLTDINPR